MKLQYGRESVRCPSLGGIPAPAGHERLTVYAPSVKFTDIYFPHPGKQPILKYNHDVDNGKLYIAYT